MPRLKFTDRAIENLPKSDKRIDYWDTEITGFCVRSMPSGRKSWAIKTRDGFQSLGTYPLISVKVARTEARRLFSRQVLGLDTAKTEKPPGDTMSALWQEYTNRANGGERNNRVSIGKLYVLPKFKDIPITNIKSSDIDTLVRSLSNKQRTGTAVKRHLHGAFQLARVLNLFPEDKINPASLVKGYPYKPRIRFLSDSELVSFANQLKNTRFQLLHTELIKLLFLTGARIGELLTAEWNMIDSENPALILHKHKTDKLGVKRIELGQYAYDFINSLPRFAVNNYIFYGQGGIGHLTNTKRPFQSIRKLANVNHFTIHDIRRTFASVCLHDGLTSDEIGILLGHRDISTTGIYAISDIKHRQSLISRAETSMVTRLGL
ncbi:MAG: integrase family protein [Candidatus Cloacimonetes bacterium]|nr:integrase family protein [Candidatus Cloacimonadota bacterium]